MSCAKNKKVCQILAESYSFANKKKCISFDFDSLFIFLKEQLDFFLWILGPMNAVYFWVYLVT
jgi:hypothetical protein